MSDERQNAPAIVEINLRTLMAALSLVLAVAASLMVAPAARAQTFTVLHQFAGGSDGSNPYSSLVQDRAGNLYGVAPYGGSQSCETQSGIGCGPCSS